MKTKFVIIGSNSFSGSDFIDLLLEDQKNEVLGISRSPEKKALFLPYLRHKKLLFTFRQLDLNHDMEKIFRLLDEFKPEYVVNFAAQSEVAPSWEYPHHWFQTNAVALTQLAHYLKDVSYLKRYVHISSPEVYGTCIGRVTESASLNPSTPYAASKAAGDLSLSTFVKNFNLPLVTIRSTNVYGAHQQLFKIIPRSIIFLKKGKTIELHGGGKAIKSYIHVRDVSQGELLALQKGKPGQIYHFSPNRGVAVKDVVKLICQELKVNYRRRTKTVGERLGQDAAYVIDSSKAKKQLGWKPVISLEEGITSVINWVNANWSEIQKQPFEYIHKE